MYGMFSLACSLLAGEDSMYVNVVLEDVLVIAVF